MINCPVQPYEFLVETVDILETPFDIGDLSKYPNDYIISTNLHGDIVISKRVPSPQYSQELELWKEKVKLWEEAKYCLNKLFPPREVVN